ncbi:MAG: DUF4214 domain-containing protein, partial [Candidatus Eremiobacteraeota bacterium]|nr:DUF4214 domain-containing protein [Candidatus Eremiobacteraeota bacterium]
MGAIENLSADEQIESFYVGYFDRAADSQGYLYWQTEYLNDISSGMSESQALLSIANLFAPQSETQTNYPQMSQILAFQDHPTYGPGGPPLTIVSAVDAFITAVYENLFNRAPDAKGLAYWSGQILGWDFATNSSQAISPIGDVIIQIENGAQGTDIVTLDNKLEVADYFTQQGASASLGFQPLSKSYLAEASSVVLNTTDASGGAAVPGSVDYGEAAVQAYIAAATSTSNTYTLTIGQDTLPGPNGPPATGHDVFNAPLVPPAGGQLHDQPTLTNFDSLVDTFFQGVASSVLNASFDGSANASGLNIVNIPTWNIQNIDRGYYDHDSGTWHYGTVTLTGDGPSGPSNINGLTTLNYNANSGGDSLIIGDNAEPIQTGNGGNANGFAINVSNALGNGYNGVDVDIWAGDFPTTGSTITVDAEAVGGFQEDNGSYLVPWPILGTYGDPDNYDPNWVGYGEHAFAIAAGASAGPNGPVGFTTWAVKSTAATAIGSLNIIALGGEGSTSATTLSLSDDGSNTMLYATYLSDSLLSDWENLTTINLANTSGFVTLTGAETTAQEGSSSYSYGFGGLLTDTGTGGT